MVATLMTLAALAIALLVPDTMEIVNYRESDAQSDWRRSVGFLAWRTTFAWTVVVFGLFAASYRQLAHFSEFLYYQF